MSNSIPEDKISCLGVFLFPKVELSFSCIFSPDKFARDSRAEGAWQVYLELSLPFAYEDSALRFPIEMGSGVVEEIPFEERESRGKSMSTDLLSELISLKIVRHAEYLSVVQFQFEFPFYEESFVTGWISLWELRGLVGPEELASYHLMS